MTKLKISKYFDILTTSIILFLLFFCWIKFYTKNPVLSGIFAVIFMCLGVFIIFFINFKHEKKKTFSKKQEQQAINCALQLQFSTQEKVNEFFTFVLKQKYKILSQNFGFILEKDGKKYFFVADFRFTTLNLDRFSQIYSKAKDYQISDILICSNSFDDSTTTFARGIKNIKINLFDKFSTYSTFVEPFGILPEKSIDITPEKLKFKEILALTVQKHRIKHYFLSGLILFLCSFFVPYKFYYLFFGSIGFILAIITLIITNKRPKRLDLK